ncbi:MAG: carcinine hydrolase/isopenicillin-N N-acyltransferase family protein [Clostridia bacterium]|nr:carcinine hydrolase/isopenicillin-N N-acyltransferase family protein [Clostridia bacterium]
MVKSAPKKGYKSISMCDLFFCGYGDGFYPDSSISRLLCLAAIYLPMDGMNEKGLAISVLDLPDEGTEQDNGNPDVITSFMIRLILDRAATVNEAIEMFKSYDMHKNYSTDTNYHFFLSDAEGDYAAVEYIDNKINVIRKVSPDDCKLTITNHYLTAEKSHIGDVISDTWNRYNVVNTIVNDAKGIMTIDEAMNTLSHAVMVDVYYEDWDCYISNQWSAVYNLDKLTLSLCVGMKYDKMYEFSI